jgi:two-component system chemotaxis response regulator CheY
LTVELEVWTLIIVPNLLVTDDDIAFRQVVSEALVRRGFSVAQAGDGKEAMEVIRNTQIHIALVDVHMPRMSGLELMEQLSRFLTPPLCVLMSAELDEEIEREALRVQAYRVLSKPIRLRVLSDVICGALAEVYHWHPPERLA